MENELEDLFSNVIRLTSAQRELVYEEAGAVARDINDTELEAHVTRATSHEGHVRELERKRTASGGSRAEYLPEVPPLDGRVDQSFTGLRGVVEGHMKGEEVDQEVQEKGRELLQGIFPGGVRAITQLPYVDQARESQDIVVKLQTTFADHVTFFGLQRKVTSLAALVAEYADSVRRSPAYVAYSEVQAADDRGQKFLLEIVSRVLGMTFDSDNPVHAANRARVLGVLRNQMEQTRSRRAARRRRRAADADVGADAAAPPAADTCEPDEPATDAPVIAPAT